MEVSLRYMPMVFQLYNSKWLDRFVRQAGFSCLSDGTANKCPLDQYRESRREVSLQQERHRALSKDLAKFKSEADETQGADPRLYSRELAARILRYMDVTIDVIRSFGNFTQAIVSLLQWYQAHRGDSPTSVTGTAFIHQPSHF
jgi:hypothetical protein